MSQLNSLSATSLLTRQSQTQTNATSQDDIDESFAKFWSSEQQDAAESKSQPAQADETASADGDRPDDEDIDETDQSFLPDQNRPANHRDVGSGVTQSTKGAEVGSKIGSVNVFNEDAEAVTSQAQAAELDSSEPALDDGPTVDAETHILTGIGTIMRQGTTDANQSQTGKSGTKQGRVNLPNATTLPDGETPVPRTPSAGVSSVSARSNPEDLLDAGQPKFDGPLTSTPKLPETQLAGPTVFESTAALTSRTQATPPTTQTLAENRVYAQQVAQQITAAIVQTSGGTTEIMLNPEELGRVRIAMTTGDAGITVSLLAERPETTDLMRRHIEHLTRELRDMGYDNPTFNFENQRDGSGDPHDENTAFPSAMTDQSTGDATAPVHHRVALSGGLDLKL